VPLRHDVEAESSNSRGAFGRRAAG